jgi:SAM-dependent methyltransferase
MIPGAVLSDPAKRGGRWDRAEFLATGEADVTRLMAISDRLGRPLARSAALDFGAGAGRISRALARRFDRVEALDVSSAMVELARAACADQPNVTIALGDRHSLSGFATASFDLVFSTWVLQHLPTEADARAALGDLAGLVAPGGLLAVQVPGSIPLRHRLQPRRRLYAVLSRIGVRSETLLGALRLSPIRMTGLRQREARAILAAAGLETLEVHAAVIAGSAIDSFTYYATRQAAAPER